MSNPAPSVSAHPQKFEPGDEARLTVRVKHGKQPVQGASVEVWGLRGGYQKDGKRHPGRVDTDAKGEVTFPDLELFRDGHEVRKWIVKVNKEDHAPPPPRGGSFRVFVREVEKTVDPVPGGAYEVDVELMPDTARIAAAVAYTCQEMWNVGHAFQGKPTKFNALLWRTVRANTFAPKEGVSPSAAMSDVFGNPGAYEYECATSIMIVFYRAMQHLLGVDAFDRVHADMQIGMWDYGPTFERYVHTEDAGTDVEADAAWRKKFQVGDYAYIKNWDVNYIGKEWMASVGQNAICLGRNGSGDPLFYGHFGDASFRRPLTEKEIGDHLVEFPRTFGGRDPTLRAKRAYIVPDVFDA